MAMSETLGELGPVESDESEPEVIRETPQHLTKPRQENPIEPLQPVTPPETPPMHPLEPEGAEPERNQPTPEKPVSQSTSGTVVTKENIEEGGGLFNFDDADVYSVIQTIFGDILRVNYIIDQRVKGRVNFRSVAPVAKKDILPLMEVILRLNGIGIVEAGGLYRIVPISDLPKEPTSVGFGREIESIVIEGKALVQIVPVNYVQSSELVRVLTPFLSTNALIVDVPKSNHIVIVDTDSNVKRLLQLVGIFDSEELKQIKPQVFVYPVQNSKANDIANLLQQIFLGEKSSTTKIPATTTKKSGTAISKLAPSRKKTPTPVTPDGGESFVSESTRIFPDETSNTIIILATKEDYSIIAETIKKIDIVPRQVMLEALVAEIKLGDNMEFGLAWSLKTDLDSLDGKIRFRDTSLANAITDPDSNILGTFAGFAVTGVDSSGALRLLLDTLASESKVKVLASPHILVSDNREAKIQIGDEVPVATSETNLSGTAQIQRTIQYRTTGIILTVKPQVNEGGLVSLDISQEVSNFTIEKIFDSDQVVISKREATTNLVVQDGQTIIIGGLIREDTSKAREGIPFLSKIPILGYLFGNTRDEYDRTELIILLTPHVIRNQKEAEDISSKYINRIHDLKEDIEKLQQDITTLE
jgi:type II secretory pathway component GspD/PulD (secretin)